ncbi:MAG: glycosyltransferase family 4 protein [Terriglobia bacterium]
MARQGLEPNDPPRVLFVSNQSAFSGAEASLCQLASHIDNARFSLFAAIGAEGTFTERLREADVRVICPGHGFGSTHIEQAVYLGELISQLKPDVVHLNALAPPETLFMLLLSGIPLVTHYRVSEIAAFADQVRASTRVVAVSQFCKSQVVRAGVHESRVCVIYDEVDTREFAPAVAHRSEARREMGVPPDAFVILMVARFAPNKRHDLFLKAVEEARMQIPGLRVILKGESHGEDSTVLRVRERAATSALAGCVEIIPFVDDIRLCYASADVLVLWSDREALGRCVVEGMSMGLPVVVTDSGGARELVKEGETGFVRPSNDTSGLARLLVALSRDPAQREQIGLNARLFAEANLEASVSAAKMMEVYDSMLAESTARRSSQGLSD